MTNKQVQVDAFMDGARAAHWLATERALIAWVNDDFGGDFDEAIEVLTTIGNGKPARYPGWHVEADLPSPHATFTGTNLFASPSWGVWGWS